MQAATPKQIFFMACSMMEKPLMKYRNRIRNTAKWTFVLAQRVLGAGWSWLLFAGLVFVFVLLCVFALVIIGILERQGFGQALGSESFLVFPGISI